MKNITAQYRDLQEGKLSKANFMTNVRREFPQWISPVNSFDDAVRILKSKRVLNESLGDSIDQRMMSAKNVASNIFDIVSSNASDDEIKAAAERYVKDSSIAPEVASIKLNDPEWLEDVKVAIRGFESTGKGEDDGYNKTPTYPDIPFMKMTEDEALNEAEKKEPTIDQVDYIQLQKGTEFELSKVPVISDENYAKAKQKAYKNLVKDPNAYRHLSVANYKDVKKKDKALETQDVKKDNLADKANEQKTIVKNAKPNTKDNLGKQEKAKKGIPDGVKQLREAMLDEFAAIPQPKKTFGVGQEVEIPEGVGTVTNVTDDGTATVKLPNGQEIDKQTNILKQPSEKSPAQKFGKLSNVDLGKSFEKLKKMSMEELKEKLMKSLEETMYKDPKTKKTYTASDAKGEQALKSNVPGVQKIAGSESVTST